MIQCRCRTIGCHVEFERPGMGCRCQGRLRTRGEGHGPHLCACAYCEDCQVQQNALRFGQPLASEGYVYLIEMGETGLVKVGWSVYPDERLKVLQTASPIPLRLLVQFPGDRKCEGRLHRRLKEHRVHGEWFELTPAILDVLRDELGGCLDRLEHSSWDRQVAA